MGGDRKGRQGGKKGKAQTKGAREEGVRILLAICLFSQQESG